MQTYKNIVLFLIYLGTISLIYAGSTVISHDEKSVTQDNNNNTFFMQIQHYDSVLEGQVLTFDMVLNQPRKVETIVEFHCVDISTAVEKDYTLLDKKIIIPIGETEATVRIQTLEDNQSEAIEFFSLEAKVILKENDFIISTIGIIQDNTVPITLKVEKNEVQEGDSMMVDINISQKRDIDTIIHLSHSEISADRGKDYIWTDKEVIIPAKQQHITVPIQTLKDDIVEEPESFLLQAEMFLYNTTIVAKATETILDTTPKMELSISNAVAKEGDKLSFDIDLNVKNASDVVVGLTSTERSAEEDKDYKLPVTGITIPSGEKHKHMEIDAIKDSTSELNETFILNGKISLYNKVYSAKGEGKIIDTTEDLNFSLGDKASQEGEIMTFDIVLNHPSSEDTVLLVDTIDKTAQKEKDYKESTNKTVIIPSGTLTGSVNIPILSDNIVEHNETFFLHVELNSSFNKGYEQNATGTIINK